MTMTGARAGLLRGERPALGELVALDPKVLLVRGANFDLTPQGALIYRHVVLEAGAGVNGGRPDPLLHERRFRVVHPGAAQPLAPGVVR